MNTTDAINRNASKGTDDVRGKTIFFFGIVGMLFLGWIIFPFFIYAPVAQPVQFSHSTHAGDNVGLKCVDCHSYDKDGRFLGIPGTSKCAGCHSHTIGVSDEEKKFVDEYILRHKEIRWVVYSSQPENVYFSHATHVKVGKLDCETCHFGHEFTDKLRPARFSRISGYSIDVSGSTLLDIPSTPSTGMRMDDCAGCHNKRGHKESCIDCHK